MKAKARIIISECLDPFYNMALEDFVFRSLHPEERILMIWRNIPSVFIGRFQNPFQECSPADMQKDGIPLLRRQSGGGTVYHDPGNTNFTFFCSRENYNEDENFFLVSDALSRGFGVSPKRSGRNDLLLKEKKISGSAFKFTGRSALHHGTLLVSADLSCLKKYLSPKPFSIKSKSIPSAPSPVTNLSLFSPAADHTSVTRALINRFSIQYGEPAETEKYTCEHLKAVPEIKKKQKDLSSWDWIYGKNPKFSFFWKGKYQEKPIEAELIIEKGYIQSVTLGAVCLPLDRAEKLQKKILHMPFTSFFRSLL